MNLHPSLNLDPANTRRREKAAQHIEKMRDTLNVLAKFIENADAETLRGNYWAWGIEEAELELTHALHRTTCEGHARMDWKHGPE